MGPPESLQEKAGEENGDSSKDVSDPLQGDVSLVYLGWQKLIVFYVCPGTSH